MGGKTLTFEDAYDPKELDRQYREMQATLGKVDTDYVNHVARMTRFNQENQRPQVNALTQFYHMQLMFSCVAPLSEGISVDTMTRAGGMFLGAYLCSKNFRAQVKEYGKQHDRQKAEKQLAKLDAWEEKHNRDLPPDKKAKRDALIMKINDGRMPLSPKSTALTHIGFAKKAYEDMRKPGADVTKIMGEYDAAVGSLYEQAQADGCDPADVARNFRMSVATLSSKDPSMNAMFAETCYGGMRPMVTSEYETRMSPNGPVTTEYAVFNGTYQNPDGSPYTGVFHLRPPMSANEHVHATLDMVARDLSDAGTDGAKFADAMIYNYSSDVMTTRRTAFADDFPNESVRDSYARAQEQIEGEMLDNLASMFDEQNPDREDRDAYPWESADFNDAFMARVYDADPELAERLYGTPDVAEAFEKYHAAPEPEQSQQKDRGTSEKKAKNPSKQPAAKKPTASEKSPKDDSSRKQETRYKNQRSGQKQYGAGSRKKSRSSNKPSVDFSSEQKSGKDDVELE